MPSGYIEKLDGTKIEIVDAQARTDIEKINDNLSNNIEADKTSDEKYPSTSAVCDYVGRELTIEEQLVERTRIGASAYKKYEFIDEFELENDVQSFVVDSDNSGNQYNFLAVSIKITTTIGSSSAPIQVIFVGDDDTEVSTVISNAITTTGATSFYYLNNNFGLYTATSGKMSNNASPFQLGFGVFDSVKKIVFKSGNQSVNIPSGTAISIYAVKSW